MRFIILLVAIICNSILNAQTITEYRYWFDNDINSGQVVLGSFGNDAPISTALQIGTLTSGLHTLHFSAKQNDGKWSSVISDVFYNTGSGGASGYEYWFDTAYSSKKTVLTPSTNNLIITAPNLNASGLKNGFHQLNIRFKPNGGMWSGVQSEMFFKRGDNIISVSYIKKIKYWFDDNWQQAQHIQRGIILTDSIAGLLDIESLSLGKHQVCYQFMDNGGVWSGISCDSFLRAPILFKEFIEPKLLISKGSCNIGDNQIISGRDFVPDGEVVLYIKMPNGGFVNLNSQITYLDSGKFTFTLPIDVSFIGGEYKVYAKDITSGAVSPEIKFWVNNVIYNSLTIIKPFGEDQNYFNKPYYITWRDFIKKENPNGTTAFVTKRYKIEHSVDNGNTWQTLNPDTSYKNLLPDRDNDQFSYPVVLNGSVNISSARARVTEVGNATNTYSSNAYSVIVSPNSGFSTSLEWDYSSPKPIDKPIGLAADGTARIIVRIKRNTGNSTPIERIDAAIESVNSSFSGINMLGKVMYATNISAYNDEANNANSTSLTHFVTNTLSPEYYFWLVAPNDFIQGDLSQLSTRKIKVVFNVFYEGSSTPVTINTDDIEIVRPPLMLVHGINSDATAFNKAHYIDNLGNEKFFDNDDKGKNNVWKVTKKITLYKNAGFLENANVILGFNGDMYDNSFMSLLNEMHYKRYASNRVDYVCHSMGGCVARTAINFRSAYYLANGNLTFNNYGKGFINKFITVNTPHNGSSIPEFLVDFKNSKTIRSLMDLGKFYTSLFDGFFNNNYTDISDAAKNMQIFKNGIALKETINVKNHLIASALDKSNTIRYGDIKLDWLTSAVNGILKKAVPWNYTSLQNCLSERYKNNEYWSSSDATVPLTSQLTSADLSNVDEMSANNFQGTNSRSVIYGMLIPYTPTGFFTLDASDVTHSEIHDNITVGNRIMVLLNSAINSSRFENTIAANPNTVNASEIYGPDGVGGIAVNASDSIFNYFDTLKIKIESPLSNSTEYVDSILIVKFNLKDTSDLHKIQLMFQGEFYESSSKVFNQSFSIKIHSNAIGKNNLIVNAVYDSSGYTVNHFDSIMLNIKCNSLLTGFYITPHSQILNKQQVFNVDYEAQFASVVGTLNYDIDSLIFNIADTNVVRYDSVYYHFITKDTGTTHIVFNYRGFKDTAYIYVSLPLQPVITLPIQLVSFNGTTQNCNTINLNWQTANEINNKEFVVEQSNDGINFSEVGKVTSKGDGNTIQNYNFTLLKNINGNHYFKLKQIDYDGKFSYSPTIVVKVNCNKSGITVIPNPASNQITVLGLDNSRKHNFQIFDNKGSLIKTINGATTNIINIKDIPNGLYLLKVDNNENLRFLKM